MTEVFGWERDVRRIFFTSGSGFVGQNVIPDLITAGHEVIALARIEKSAEKVGRVGAAAVLDDLLALGGATDSVLSGCDAGLTRPRGVARRGRVSRWV